MDNEWLADRAAKGDKGDSLVLVCTLVFLVLLVEFSELVCECPVV